jgi:hypothetical protein
MSTSIAAPTINVTAEEQKTFLMDPYYYDTRRLHDDVDIEQFDDEVERSVREHREWLEGAQAAQLERLITVLKQFEDGVVAAEPWLVERCREIARDMDPADYPTHSEYPTDPRVAAEWRETYASSARRFAALHTLADRLEGACVAEAVA